VSDDFRNFGDNRSRRRDFDDDDAPPPPRGRGRGRRGAPGGYAQRRSVPARRRVCSFCVDKIDYIDYRRPELLQSYIAGNGKISSRRRTGACARHQRRVATAIKRARFLALLPYTAEHVRLHGGGGRDS
jgi:small subunit ribosomal protein S18